MRKIIIFLLPMLLFTNQAFAAKGKAAVYKITMTRAALCTGNPTGSECAGAVVLGDDTQVVDIAAVDAGTQAASYGDAALLPLGTTFTHFQVRMDRKFIVKTSSTASEHLKTDAGKVCQTIENADSMYDSDEATDKYTHIPAIDEGTGTTLGEMNVYMMNAGTDSVEICTNTSCGSSSSSDWDYDTNAYATAQQATALGDTYHEIIYTLTTPYTVTMIPPKITMAFGTAEALGAFNTTGTLCRIQAQEPVFTINID